jgi:hypothetical protein
MEFNSNLEERFVSKLIKDTKNGEVVWTDDPNKNIVLPSNERAANKIYTTTVLNKRFRIYEFQVKNYTDEDQWDWIERVKLEVIDAEGLSLYEFSYDFSLSKLFSAVRKASSGIDDIMKEYLKE